MPSPQMPIRTLADAVRWLRAEAGRMDNMHDDILLESVAIRLEAAIAATPPAQPLERAALQHAKAINIISLSFMTGDAQWRDEILARLAKRGLLLCEADEIREDAPPATPWRDMETAPRDGTPIVLQGDDLRVEGKTVVAHWGTYVIEYWHVEDGKFEPRPLRGPEPTRWMPLPPPPTQATTQEAQR